MRHVGQKTVLGLGGVLQLDIFFLQGILDPFAVSDIANSAHDERPFLGLQRTEADFDGELSASPAAAIEFETSPHGTRAGSGKIIGAMADMTAAETIRQQDFNGLADKMAGGKVEKFL